MNDRLPKAMPVRSDATPNDDHSRDSAADNDCDVIIDLAEDSKCDVIVNPAAARHCDVIPTGFSQPDFDPGGGCVGGAGESDACVDEPPRSPQETAKHSLRPLAGSGQLVYHHDNGKLSSGETSANVKVAHGDSKCGASEGQSRNQSQSGNQLVDAPPDGGWGWVVVAGAALTFFFTAGLSRSFTLIYQQLLLRFDAGAVATSAVAAIFGTVKMCSSPIVSLLCARFSKRPVVIAGGVLTGVAMVLSAYPPSLPYLYVTYGVLAAFGTNMAITPSFAIVGEYFKKKRAKAMALAMLGGSLGGIALPPLLDFLLQRYAYTGTMVILAAAMLNLCVTGALFRTLGDNNRSRQRESPTPDKVDSPLQVSSSVGNHGDGATTDGDKSCHDDDDDDDDDDDKMSEIGELENLPRALLEAKSKRLSQCDIKVADNTGSVTLVTPDGAGRQGDADKDPDATVDPSTIWQQGARPPRAARQVSFSEQVKESLVLPPRSRSLDVDLDLAGDKATDSSSADAKNTCCVKCRDSLGIHLFRKPRFIFYSLLMFGSIMSLSISGTFLSGLVRELGLQDTDTAILLSISGAVDIPSKFISGVVFDIRKIRKLRSVGLAVLGFLTGAFVLGMGFANSYLELFILYMCYTFFASAYHTQHATVLTDLVGPRNISSAMGLCRLFQGLGFAMGPTLGGYLRDICGTYRVAYYFSGTILLISTTAFTAVDLHSITRRRQKQRPEPLKGHVARYRHDSISTVT